MSTPDRAQLRKDFVGNVITLELFNLIVGDFLGAGQFRTVCRYKPDPNYVIKFETKSQSFSNVMEWRIWNFYEKKPLGKWLAPCLDISPAGSVLIQAYAEDVVGPDLPTEVPYLFTDMSPYNWGVYKKRTVCRDYANLRFMQQADTEKMRPANWRWKRTTVVE